MLAETKLRVLKPKDKLYKLADRDGLYVTVAKSGLITFHFDYQINDRHETLTIGKYPIVSLASAREKLLDVK
ncbi:Arm DNA-binding domain-containing protein [Pectobacterium carotovorum]|uniref:Arm DNA-binding domain-containing protein n=1 Tax=Pectobacterium carotovorum TaxID=554 RepID=UPI003017B733